MTTYKISPYHKALLDCAIRYDNMMAFHRLPAFDPLWQFCHEFERGCRAEMPVPKLCRWLGYIQGVLIERGFTTVDRERDWTRPLFRPLDFPGDALTAVSSNS